MSLYFYSWFPEKKDVKRDSSEVSFKKVNSDLVQSTMDFSNLIL